ncbi:uncharacterized protein LOC142237604 [Haematobia irritans]|uniref:uncharacterized protein LOC142237604 n=1 Tax=Haematobia irritans TaxID=7368 RepID=UPI003F4FBCFE
MSRKFVKSKAFLNFLSEYQQTHKELSGLEIMRRATSEWNKLSEQKKNIYKNEGAKNSKLSPRSSSRKSRSRSRSLRQHRGGRDNGGTKQTRRRSTSKTSARSRSTRRSRRITTSRSKSTPSKRRYISSRR